MGEVRIPIPEGLPQNLNMSEEEFTREVRITSTIHSKR
jgi:hypothetical protein